MAQTTFVNDVLRRFRDQLRLKGQYSTTTVASALRKADAEGSGRLSISEFEKQLRAVGLFMGRYELQGLMRRFGDENCLRYEEFVSALIGPMNSRRQDMVRKVFDALDRDHSGELTVNDLQSRFVPSSLPYVKQGFQKAEDALSEFIRGVRQVIPGKSDRLSLNDFLRFYQHVGANTPDDSQFARLLEAAWNISKLDDDASGGYGGLDRIIALLRDKLGQYTHQSQGIGAVLSKAFRYVDIDSTGTVTQKEFAQALGRFGIALGPAQLAAIFDVLDPSRVGRINYSAFVSMIDKSSSAVNTITPQKAGAASPAASRPPRRKALSIGINYNNLPRGQGRLEGCINDSKTIVDLLRGKWGFTDVKVLTDDNKAAMPTRANILAAIDWLVEGAQAGDSLFFHFSGHGGSDPDVGGDEKDGKDECIYPYDFQRAGNITDDELRRRLVLRVPDNGQLYALMDCCHSGTGLDLPLEHHLVSRDGTTVVQTVHNERKEKAAGEVLLISGCKDSQTSADASDGVRPAGAMTTAFADAVRSQQNPSVLDVLVKMLQTLKAKRFTQVPQLSTENDIDVNAPFNPVADAPSAMPAFHKPAAATPAAPAGRKPRRRVLSIGINYYNLPRGQGRLEGCINDSKTVLELVKSQWGFNDVKVLTDDNKAAMPTRANILAAIDWLVEGAQAGDRLFFHFSGHGGSDPDVGGDEKDGKDECIYPYDFQRAGNITDDELRRKLVMRIPAGAKLYALMDCCHSGTGLDLPNEIVLKQVDGKYTVDNVFWPEKHPAPGDTLLISGCKDSQTSADASDGVRPAGAMTTAFAKAIKSSKEPTILDVLIKIRKILKDGGFDQVPQLSTEHGININTPYNPLL